MPLSWNEIKDRAVKFTKRWEDESSEAAEAKTFWDEFFHIFGKDRRSLHARYEHAVRLSDGHTGFVDLFWKGILLVEHKSRGKDLTSAYNQAVDYLPGIKASERPRYILVSDFARFRLEDVVERQNYEFPLEELLDNIGLFGFIAGYQTHSFGEQDPVNVEAAERLGKLHDQLLEVGYTGHQLEVYLVRLLFCMYAEDTAIFERSQFQFYLEDRTSPDGSDTGMHLAQLFQTLNTPPDQRMKTLDEQLAGFAYVNGRLFEEQLPLASFTSAMRETLLECCGLDWSRLSPAIFGSLFQSIMDKDARRNLGAHYTSEVNILKAIRPLFLDSLRAEFESIKGSKPKLREFHEKLAGIKVFDPACGCGNFLVIAYRELRLLELDVMRVLYKREKGLPGLLNIGEIVKIDVDQMYGIEIEEFPAQIAQVALWLTDHQMNRLVSNEFGLYFARLPLAKTPHIANVNALTTPWEEIIDPAELDYIVGNPPFGGAKYMDTAKREEMKAIFHDTQNAGLLDYVTCWYRRAAEYMQANPAIRAALVSTNSITQGEQVGVLWPDLYDHGV